MKTKSALLAATLLCLMGCTSLGTNTGSKRNTLQAQAAEVDEQIDNANYMIYKTYEEYQAAKSANRERKEISELEIYLGKLNEIKDYLEGEQFRILREIKDT